MSATFWDNEELDDFFNQTVPRIFKDKSNPLECLDDAAFRYRYRFGKRSFLELVEILANNRNNRDAVTVISPIMKLSIFLDVLSRNNMQFIAGELSGVSQSSVSRIVTELSDFFAMEAGHFIKWPTAEEAAMISKRYFDRSNIPGIVGCIDGTHVRILRPNEEEEAFINRKGYHSLNVGAVVDDKRRFRWVAANWPGRAHDSRVFKESQLYADLSSKSKTGIICGDSAYAAEFFLLKPLLGDRRSVSEVRYTNALCRVRCDVEHAFGVLKRQFHALHGEMRYQPHRASKMVVSAICLRNHAIDTREPEFDDELPESDSDSDDDDDVDNLTSQPGAARMRDIISKYF